jgi:hypothetical protein
MGGDTDRTLCRFGSVRMLMRGERHRRPEGQQHAETRYPLRYRPHDGNPREAFLESIPKRQTNAKREYLARQHVKDPYLGPCPTLGACRPDIRKQLERGEHIFVISGRIPGVQPVCDGGL